MCEARWPTGFSAITVPWPALSDGYETIVAPLRHAGSHMPRVYARGGHWIVHLRPVASSSKRSCRYRREKSGGAGFGGTSPQNENAPDSKSRGAVVEKKQKSVGVGKRGEIGGSAD